MHELANQGINLAQAQWGLRTAFEEATNKAIFLHAHFQGRGASLIDGCRAVLFGQGENAQDAAHAHFALLVMNSITDARRCVGRHGRVVVRSTI